MNLSDYSDPEIVLYRAKFYFGEDVKLLKSTRKTKKYMIYNPITNKFVHFGAMGYLDYTKYIQIYDIETANQHRTRYLKRALKIKGKWMNNPYSPNFLSILLLWNYS
jgi:hypothetical protein